MRAETRQSIVLAGGTGLTALLSLVYLAYAARVLGPEKYGELIAALSFAYLFSLILGPINPTVARFTAQYATRGDYGKIRTLSREITRRLMVYGWVGVLIGLVLLKPLTSALRLPSPRLLLIAYGVVFLTVLLNVPRGVLRGVQRFGKYNLNIVLEAVARLVAGLILFAFVREATSGLLGYLVALGVIVLYSRFQTRAVWAGHECQAVDGGSIRRFTVPMFLLAIGHAGFQHIDVLLVKHYSAAEQAGFYAAAASLAKTINVLVTPFSLLVLPLLTTLRARDGGIAGPFARICAYFLILAAVPLGLFWVWPEAIMVLVYEAGFAPAAPFLFPLAAALVFGCLSTLISLSFVSANRFQFLWVYASGLAAEVVGLAIWHASLQSVVTVVLIAQAATAGAMSLMFAADLFRHRR